MLPEWHGVRCPSCVERQAESRSSEAAKERRRPLAAKYQRDRYAANREQEAKNQRARRLAKKLRGECIRCSQPASDVSIYCPAHYASEKVRVRDQQRRRRGGGALPR